MEECEGKINYTNARQWDEPRRTVALLCERRRNGSNSIVAAAASAKNEFGTGFVDNGTAETFGHGPGVTTQIEKKDGHRVEWRTFPLAVH